jgi:hypothetical protein
LKIIGTVGDGTVRMRSFMRSASIVYDDVARFRRSVASTGRLLHGVAAMTRMAVPDVTHPTLLSVAAAAGWALAKGHLDAPR